MKRATDFATRVRHVVRRIPHGRVATYGDVAAAAGKPRAHRAVGNIMRATTDSSIPCHRVISAGGKLGGYGRDLFAKRALLLAEGIIVSAGRVRNFRDLRWKGRRGNFPKGHGV
jgi:O-6-methylguanine DNA methyltransferase